MGDLTKARNKKKQEVNFWARFVPIMTSQEISQKMSDEWKPKHDINQASKHGTRWYLGIPDLAKARNGQSLEVKFWLKFVPRISQELSQKRATDQNLSTGKTKFQPFTQGKPISETWNEVISWNGIPCSKTWHVEISRHGGPNQGRKREKPRSQF